MVGFNGILDNIWAEEVKMIKKQRKGGIEL